MATDFAVALRRFLTGHLAGLRGYSPNTILSYRDAFKLLICYFRDERSVPPEKLTLEQVDADAITGFLAWLRTTRHNSASTCNQRLAAIDSFFTWMQTQDPARLACCQDILAIPASRVDRPAVAYLTVEQTRQLLAAPDRSTRNGRRDATLLATLYDTAARVQELADLTVRDIRLDHPAMTALTGKGRKSRHVPIDDNTTALLVKRWLLGTHQSSVGPAHLQSYLNEFVFRFNRRRSRARGMLFYRVLQLAVTHAPVRYRDLVADPTPKRVTPRPPTRRGHPPSLNRPLADRPWREIPSTIVRSDE